jgi:hypothetical protein
MKKVIFFIDESLYMNYAINIWWIDLGATVQVVISMHRLKDIIDLRKGYEHKTSSQR